LRFTGTDSTVNLTDAGFVAGATEVVDLDMVNPADALYIRGGEGGFIEADTISGTATSDLVPMNSASSANVFTTQTNVLGATFNLYSATQTPSYTQPRRLLIGRPVPRQGSTRPNRGGLSYSHPRPNPVMELP
jgi:hypothetical protein